MMCNIYKIFYPAFIFSCCINIIYSQWIQVTPVTYAELLDVQFINPQTGFIVGDIGKFLTTTNGGSTWSAATIEFYNINRSVNFINPNTGFISTSKELAEPYRHYLYRTTNAGENWSEIFNAGEHSISKINFSDLAVGYFSITRCDTLNVSRMYRGPAQGPWTLIYSSPDCGINTVKFKTSIGYAAGYTEGKVFKSTDYGNSWQVQNLGYTDPVYEMHLFNKDTVILSGANGKIFKTTNGGTNWNPVSSGTSHNLGKMSFPDSLTGYVVTSGYDYIKTTDGGNSWRVFSTGFQQNMNAVHFINAYTGFLAGHYGMILKTTTGGTIGIKNISSAIPEKFELMQNYPNPFNPSTKIRFQIPLLRGLPAGGGRGVLVKIVVYDILGREIETLVNESLLPGTYEVEWNTAGGAINYPSGVYYYKLSTDKYQVTKRMILIK